MFKVYFENSFFANCSSIEEAVSLGLAVHRSSNVPHHIEVTESDNSHVISFDLIAKPGKENYV